MGRIIDGADVGVAHLVPGKLGGPSLGSYFSVFFCAVELGLGPLALPRRGAFIFCAAGLYVQRMASLLWYCSCERHFKGSKIGLFCGESSFIFSQFPFVLGMLGVDVHLQVFED